MLSEGRGGKGGAGVRPAAAAGRVKVMDAAASVRRHRAAMRRL